MHLVIHLSISFINRFTDFTMPTNVGKMLKNLRLDLKAGANVSQTEWIFVTLPLVTSHSCHGVLSTNFSDIIEGNPKELALFDADDLEKIKINEKFDIVSNCCILGNNLWSKDENDNKNSSENTNLVINTNDKFSDIETINLRNNYEISNVQGFEVEEKTINEESESDTDLDFNDCNIIPISLQDVFNEKKCLDKSADGDQDSRNIININELESKQEKKLMNLKPYVIKSNSNEIVVSSKPTHFTDLSSLSNSSRKHSLISINSKGVYDNVININTNSMINSINELKDIMPQNADDKSIEKLLDIKKNIDDLLNDIKSKKSLSLNGVNEISMNLKSSIVKRVNDSPCQGRFKKLKPDYDMNIIQQDSTKYVTVINKNQNNIIMVPSESCSSAFQNSNESSFISSCESQIIQQYNGMIIFVILDKLLISFCSFRA